MVWRYSWSYSTSFEGAYSSEAGFLLSGVKAKVLGYFGVNSSLDVTCHSNINIIVYGPRLKYLKEVINLKEFLK